MPKRKYGGRHSRVRPGQFSISMSRAAAAEVHDRVEALKLKGPSEFVQRLMSEGRAAKLPVMVGDPASAHLPYHSHEWVPPTEE